MIQLLEGDGFLYDDGKPRNIIVSVDGKKFPFSAERTISDLYIAAEKMPGGNKPALPEPVSEIVNRVITSIPNAIEKNDIVRYTGPISPNNIDLSHEAEYRVIAHEGGVLLANGMYNIINDKSGFPLRLNVPKQFVVLVRKNPIIPIQRKDNFEILDKCKCGEDVVLTLSGNTYSTVCSKCYNVITRERKDPNEQPTKATP